MTLIKQEGLGGASRIQISLGAPELQYLTAAQVSRWLAYTPAQLHQLVLAHGLPLPFDAGPRHLLWVADEIEDWRRRRNQTLGF